MIVVIKIIVYPVATAENPSNPVHYSGLLGFSAVATGIMMVISTIITRLLMMPSCKYD